MRFTSGDTPAIDDDYRYEFAAAIRRTGKRWPRGQYVLAAYDEVGTLLERRYVDEHKTLDKDLRQLSETLYAVALARTELIFEPDGTSSGAESWEPIDFRVLDSAEPLGVQLRGVRAESHSDFEYSNLLVVRVSGRAEPLAGLPWPPTLWVQITILDEAESVLNSEQVDVSYGAASLRPFEASIKVLDHMVPDIVVLEAFTF